MRKGYDADMSMLFIGMVAFILFGIAVWAVINASGEIRSDFPGTSGKIGSQLLMQEFISEDCVGAGIVGILNKIKLDGKPNCFNDPSFYGHVRVEDQVTGTVWEWGEMQDEFSLQSSMPVMIHYDDGTFNKGIFSYSFSYITDDLLLLLRSCADEAFYTGNCERRVKVDESDADLKVKFEGNQICGGGKCLETVGKFENVYEYEYKKPLSRGGTPVTIVTIRRTAFDELELSNKNVEMT